MIIYSNGAALNNKIPVPSPKEARYSKMYSRDM